MQKTVDTKTISAPGTSFSSEVKGEYTWDVSGKQKGANAQYSAELRRVVLRINGQNAVDETPASNEVQVQVDGKGRVIGVTGADTLAQGIVGRLPPEQQKTARGLIDDAAKTAIAERFQLTVGDLEGRPTSLGSSWTISTPDGGPVRSKTWKVQGVEVCGSEQCLRVESSYDIDSAAISEQLRGDLAGYLVDEDGAVHEVQLSDVTVQARDSIVVEPNTLFLHSARFEQTARVVMEQQGKRSPMLITQVRELTTMPR